MTYYKTASREGIQVKAVPAYCHLLCFDAVELRTLRRALRHEREIPLAGSRHPCVAGELDGVPVVALRLPFGDDPALLRRVLGAFLDVMAPARLLAMGTVMALDASLAIGDVAVVEGASHEGKRVACHALLREAALAMPPRGMEVFPAVTATVSTFVSGAESRERVRRTHPDCAVLEMEDYHVASMAEARGIPFLSLRTVTDYGDMGEHLRRLPEAARRALAVLRRTLRRLAQVDCLAEIDNPNTADLPWRMVLRYPGRSLSIPEAVTWARRARRRFGLEGWLEVDARVTLLITEEVEAPAMIATPSGTARILRGEGWCLVRDPFGHGLRIVARPAFLTADGATVAVDFDRCSSEKVELGRPAVVGDFTDLGGLHVQGLNSVSAEPEEGLLAATTIEEFRLAGLAVVSAAEAGTWIYRTANASSDSYFEADYRLPMREGGIRGVAHLVATGLGPAIDMEARGGGEADVLVVGDEQGGRLVNLFEDLAAAPIRADELFRHPGVALRLTENTVVLSRIDRRFALTSRGLETLRYDPATLRSIYHRDYDRVLEDYFGHGRLKGRKAVLSVLLATSRGCGARCAICCSGGYQPYAALSAEKVLDVLRELRDHHGLDGERFADVYVLDSYFNRQPERVIRLSEGLEAEGLLPCFAFHVRHNGLKAFLRPSTPEARPEANERLILAYEKLGIREIVLGIDAYTDESIRILKTDVRRLATEGACAPPAYRWIDIRAVLTAIDAHGLDSRCFCLRGNPFVDDADRLRSWYNLVTLSLELPGFAIDAVSSEGVNELKAFHGAPLSAVTESMVDLRSELGFCCSSCLDDLETLLDLSSFVRRRRSRGAWERHVVALQEIRAEVAARLHRAFRRWKELATGERYDVTRVAKLFLRRELRLRRLFLRRIGGDAELLAREEGVEKAVARVARLFAVWADGYEGRPSPAGRRFFAALPRALGIVPETQPEDED